LARPADPQLYGYISEYHGFGKTEAESGDYAEDLAATMLASTLGIEFDHSPRSFVRARLSRSVPGHNR
jgi:arginine decarboxylase